MAITIHQQPSSTLAIPVNNPIEYLVSSTNTSEENFKLSCKIIVGGTEVKELKYDVIPSTAYVIAEIQRLIEGNSTYFLNEIVTESTGNSSTINVKTLENARCVFQEWYSNPSSGDPSYQGSQSSGTAFYIYNGAFKYREWQNNDWHNYTIPQPIGGVSSNDNSKLMLTSFSNYHDSPTFSSNTNSGYCNNLDASQRYLKIRPSDHRYIINQIVGGGNQDIILYFHFYDSNFTLNTSTAPQRVADLYNANQLKRQHNRPFSIDLFNANDSNVWQYLTKDTGGAKDDVSSSNTKYVALHIREDASGGTWYQVSKVYLYEIDWDTCSKYESYEIHWLNHLGGWDSWVFDKRSEKQVLVNRSNFTQPLTRRIESNTIIHDAYARKQKQFYTDISERFIVNSDILKDWEYEGLTDLLQSPLVYWRHPDYGFLAINIVDQDSYPIRTQLNDKSYNMSFTFEINNYDKLQGL